MAWYHRLWNLGRTKRLNDEIDRELAFHVAERADALRAAGVAADEAEREAKRRVGHADLHRERARDADVVAWLDSLLRDVRHAVRSLLRAPVFTAVAVGSLALGIGGSTAIFALIDAVMLRPLPVPAPEDLVVIGMDERPEAYFTNPLWEELDARQSGLSAVAAFSESHFNTADGGEPRRVYGVYVSGDYFRLFGARPAVGRLIGPSDDVRGCAPVAVLGHGFWRREFEAAGDVVGRSISLEGVTFEVVGVARPGFAGPVVGREAQVYVPICTSPVVDRNPGRLDARSSWWLRVMGRREASLGVDQVDARLAAISPAAFESVVPANFSTADQQEFRQHRFMATASPAGVSSLRERYGDALTLLMAGVALVLLISSANVANLLLARSSA
ncbi:MAG: ABC transporter permease, partial [Longimicrobiales bacterium]